MELYFDFPTIETSTEERNEFLIEASFNIGSSNNIDLITSYTSEESNSIDFAFIARSEHNKHDCYQDFKSKLKIIKDEMGEELIKINSVYIDLENLSIDEFEKKYFSMEDVEESTENMDSPDELNELFDKLTSYTNEQLLDLWKTQDWNSTKMYNDLISIRDYKYYLSQELIYRCVSIPE